MHTLAVSRLQLESELRAALNHHQLRVFYQPIVLLETRAIVGFEALVRWQHAVHGLISPAKFIDAAAARHFSSPHLTDRIRTVLRETQIEPSVLQLGITDRIASADASTTFDVVSQLKQLRINTAVDDCGTGSLPLSQLRRIPVDLLKIDRFLVRNMLSDRPSRDVVELLLTLGHHWKIHVLAQGIEKPSQCEALKELGCLLGQGYLFSPPIPAEAATQLLRDQLSAHPVPAHTH